MTCVVSDEWGAITECEKDTRLHSDRCSPATGIVRRTRDLVAGDRRALAVSLVHDIEVVSDSLVREDNLSDSLEEIGKSRPRNNRASSRYGLRSSMTIY
jgi:hypothetical protein